MLYELLTSKPLFPGKHEIDMISKIHNLLGTPGRDLLQRFKQNPNHQISFSFPQRLGQDLHKVLPKVSNRTIDLLSALLTYNPQMRISAENALKMECFAPFREAQAQWEASDKSLPFAVFFTTNASAGAPRPPEPPEKPVFVPPPVPKAEKPVFVPPAPELLVAVPPKPPKPIYSMPSEPTYLLPSEAAIAPIIRQEPQIVKPVILAPKPAAELMESRIRASQRIKAYKDALKAAKARKPTLHPGVAVEIAGVKPVVYPKPRPEIVQPRLPKIVL
jgi:renal tumor antigen